MVNRIERALKDLVSSLQVAKIYTTEHPRFKESLEQAYKGLGDILKEKDEIVIGIVGEELASGKEIFFDLSQKIKPVISYLKKIGIEKIIFHRGLKIEEIQEFIKYLAMPVEEIKRDVGEYFTLVGIRNITVGKVKASASPDRQEIKAPIDYLKQYEQSIDKVSGALEKVLETDTIDYLDLRFTVSNIMEILMGRHQEFLKLTEIKRHDLFTFIHLLNVSILAMYFSSKMGFKKEDILDIGIAALFHDIGKLYISQKIISKPGKLSDEEFARIKSHTFLGSEILLGYVDSLGILPVVVAFEHHLRYDSKGYPQLIFKQKPHIASLIVSICDVYDALAQRRSYKRDYPPDMVYNLMIKERGRLLDPALLDNFFKIIGVWPIGTITLLSDGKIAIVREQNPEDILLPKVEIIDHGPKGEFIDLKERKEEVKISRSLNPLSEGQKYLSFI